MGLSHEEGHGCFMYDRHPGQKMPHPEKKGGRGVNGLI